MSLLRIRTEVDDRPGRLAGLTAALAARGANILDLSVQVGTDGVIDEFVLDVPATTTRAALIEAIAGAGGRRTAVVPAAPHELIDDAAHALTLAARARLRPLSLPQILGELLRADEAAWADPARARRAPGQQRQAATDGTLVIPVDGRRCVVLRRPGWPFTLTEAARATALVRAAGPRTPTPSRRLHLADGTEVVVRPIELTDSDAVRDLHDRCSHESRRLRYSGAEPPVPQEAFCDHGRGLTLVAEGPDGSLLALAHLMYTLDPGVAELAFLVEDGWQGRGLGRSLALRLLGVAREQGLVEARVTLLRENVRMYNLLARLGGRFRNDGTLVEGRLALGETRGNRAEPARVQEA